jgi:5-formyltetrahydrofolate cyclo-ligase
MTVSADKKSIRKYIIGRKKESSSELLKQESASICRMLEANPLFQEASIVLAYWSLDDEVDIKPLILKYCDQKSFLLPVVQDKHLELRYFEGLSSLEAGAHFGILEPIGKPFSELQKIDLVLVPGMAFDENGFRIGRGGGYYDRLLPDIHNAKKVGLGFSFQILDSIPVDPHDVAVDFVLFPQSS